MNIPHQHFKYGISEDFGMKSRLKSLVWSNKVSTSGENKEIHYLKGCLYVHSSNLTNAEYKVPDKCDELISFVSGTIILASLQVSIRGSRSIAEEELNSAFFGLTLVESIQSIATKLNFQIFDAND